jgi:dihydroorotate dehydrogenase electron transfer subunit
MRRSGGQCELDFLGRVVGNGTAWLAGLSPDSLVNVLGPLGQGFSPPSSGKRALLVAGGIGLPPIRWLGEELRRNGVVCDSIYGVRTRESLPVNLNEEPSTSGALTLCVEEFGRDGIPTCITTDDGTCGLHGRVTDGITSYFDGCDDPTSIQIYACGPEPMLRAVAAVSESRGLMCELALERMMGCGMGTCQSCVVRVVDESSTAGWRYALCCTEGPVFESSRVIWT